LTRYRIVWAATTWAKTIINAAATQAYTYHIAVFNTRFVNRFHYLPRSHAHAHDVRQASTAAARIVYVGTLSYLAYAYLRESGLDA
jgi:hypothetical protein